MKWLESWEQAMAAVAFAEAGEYESARRFAAPPRVAQRKVLLGVGSRRFTPGVLRQALDISRRIEAGLEVLHLWPTPEIAVVQAAEGVVGATLFTRLREKLGARKVFYQYVVGAGRLADEIVSHAAGRRDIILVLLAGSDQAVDAGPEQELLGRLSCPVALLRGC